MAGDNSARKTSRFTAMSNYPLKDKRAKTGSNLRGNPTAAHRAKLLGEMRKSFQRHADEYRTAAKKLFSKADLRTATAIVDRLRREYHTSNLKLGSDAEKWEANKTKLRKHVQRELARALPKLREWRGLARAFEREYQKLVFAYVNRHAGRDFHIDLSEPALSATAQEFVPPYPLYDASIYDVTSFDVHDQSFATPSIGHVINNMTLEYDEHTWILNGIFEIYVVLGEWSRAGCGINYTVPRQGRLRLGATLQNFQTRVSMSLTDNFGLSVGEIYADASLYVDIVRGSKITHLSTILVKKILESDGDDISTMLPALDNTAPYVIDVTTDEIFEAGAAVQIIAGSQFNAGARLDDMKASVNALLWSQVKKITVDVV
jgi:hypothetical protein